VVLDEDDQDTKQSVGNRQAPMMHGLICDFEYHLDTEEGTDEDGGGNDEDAWRDHFPEGRAGGNLDTGLVVGLDQRLARRPPLLPLVEVEAGRVGET
jgi:hypothetical protein